MASKTGVRSCGSMLKTIRNILKSSLPSWAKSASGTHKTPHITTKVIQLSMPDPEDLQKEIFGDSDEELSEEEGR